jgi:hypothetical protein
MESAGHQGDFTCVEEGSFRTFYMTCLCGWKAPVKILSGRFSAYYLENIWISHIGKGGEVE